MSRLSFRQLLLASLLLVVGVVSVATMRAWFAVEELAVGSRGVALQAAQVTADVHGLGERSVALERSARQYLVLEDPALLKRYGELLDESDLILARLAVALPPEYGPRLGQWRELAREALRKLGLSSRLMVSGSVVEDFRALSAINEVLAQAARSVMDRNHQRMLQELEARRLALARQLALATLGAIAIALVLGWWLARPVTRLERAIERLGESRLDNPVSIEGPADLRRLGQRLDWLRRRLAELEAEKDRFVRHVSHELKTPLAALREGIALLEDRVAGELSEDQHAVVRILKQNVLSLQSRIEGLLNYNEAADAARRLVRRRLALPALLARVVAEQQLQAQAKRLRVDVDTPVREIEADEDKLAMVLGNLLSNAIRFSPEGGRVLLRSGVSPGLVWIECSDEGAGVAPEDRERIFDPFYQGVRQPPGVLRGSGIGLSIVREHLAAHGGRVHLLDSAHGAVFRIEIPQ